MDKALKSFKEHNQNSEIIEETEHINLKLLWSDETFMCRYSKSTDFSAISEVELPIELIGIYHSDKQEMEYIFTVLTDENEFLNRNTVFFYQGQEIKTRFDEPSEALKLFALGFHRLESSDESRYRGLEVFHDFYQVEKQNQDMKDYFQDKKPYSFYVQTDFKKLNKDFIGVSKHLNVYLKFFDRRAPIIEILNPKSKDENFKLPCRSNHTIFPDQISINPIDPVALDLLQVAYDSGNTRLKYLFYYQVLEYFAYYYLDEELKRKLSNLLKSPDLVSNSNFYSRTIIEQLKDYSNNTSDKQKLTKLLLDYITIEDIHEELKCNIKNFCNDLEFDGHFKLSSILQNEDALDKLFNDGKETPSQKKEREKARQEFITTIADRIDKIRNVLVHIRESRENKVILPTRGNNRKLIPYLFLIRRISEIISIKYEA